jgi:hypothetical protein
LRQTDENRVEMTSLGQSAATTAIAANTPVILNTIKTALFGTPQHVGILPTF